MIDLPFFRLILPICPILVSTGSQFHRSSPFVPIDYQLFGFTIQQPISKCALLVQQPFRTIAGPAFQTEGPKVNNVLEEQGNFHLVKYAKEISSWCYKKYPVTENFRRTTAHSQALTSPGYGPAAHCGRTVTIQLPTL